VKNMNNKIIIGVIIAVIVIGGAAYFLNKGNSYQQNMPSQTQTQTNTNPTNGSSVMAKNGVTIQNMAFSPATLTVKVGDKVTWTNQDSVGHSSTADDNSFDTGVIAQGQSGTNTFAKAGTYTYHCSVHPNMKATIIVQ
jgi:plastocyanin